MEADEKYGYDKIQKKMKRKFQPLRLNWRPHSFTIISIVATLCLLTFRLASLVRLLPAERYMLASDANVQRILTDPLHAPLKLAQWLATFASPAHNLFFDRLPSILFATLACMLLIHLSRRWYGPRSMTLGCVMFISSAWFLHVARFAGTDIEYVIAILALIVMHVRLHEKHTSPHVIYEWLLTTLTLLFVPGLVWFVLVGFLWQWRTLVSSWKHHRSLWHRIAWPLLSTMGIGSLGITLVRHNNLLRIWLGLPSRFAPWSTTGTRIAHTFIGLGYNGPHTPQLWLGRLPLLDVFSLAMFIAGIAFYIKHRRAQRTHILLSFLLMGGLLSGLGGALRLSILLPIVYLVIMGGLAYVLHFWLRVFPRNPLARGFGIGVVAVVIGLSCIYNLREYFVAWPHSPDTVAVEGTK